MTVAVIVKESAACTPTALLPIEAGLASDIGERAVSVVVKEAVVAEETAK